MYTEKHLDERTEEDWSAYISNLLINDQCAEATRTCLKALESDQNNSFYRFQLGLSYLLLEDDYAQTIWMEAIFHIDSEVLEKNTKELANFLTYEAKTRVGNNDRQAELIILFLLELEPEDFWSHYELGNIYFRANEYELAISSYLNALSIRPETYELFISIGDSYFCISDFKNASDWYKKNYTLNPNQITVLLKIALLLKAQSKLNEAKLYLNKAIVLEGDLRIPYGLMRDICQEQGESVEASLYEGLISYCNRSYEKAASELSLVLGTEFQHVQILAILYECYMRSAKYQQANITIKRALEIYPNEISLKIKEKLGLPYLYESIDEMKLYRKMYANGLSELINSLTLESASMKSALDAVSIHTNFLLSYQGYDDLLLQQEYGKFLCKIMQHNYPDWHQSPPILASKSSRKIRIGYLSSFFQGHTICKLFKGWIKQVNKEKFEIYTYHIGTDFDLYTKRIQDNSDYFYHFPSTIEEIYQKIIEDKLDILVYPDIGMSAKIMNLAALRLAPIQCMSWGHPVTSGLQTIDYFLSSDLMEPNDAQKYYSETLIRLPGLGISYEMPELPLQPMQREYFGIKSEDIVYLSCQSLFKYLPQYDYLFPAIAQQVKNAKFVFISLLAHAVREQFINRISRAFASVGLNFQDYCIVLPSLNTQEYLSLNLASDVFLDTLDWSGGNTALEAIACDLPIVTLPGQFMRGRHSYAMLKRMNMMELIANNEADYIEIASKLGTNLTWRQAVKSRISKAKTMIFDDMDCISALEKFFHEAYSKQQQICLQSSNS